MLILSMLTVVCLLGSSMLLFSYFYYYPRKIYRKMAMVFVFFAAALELLCFLVCNFTLFVAGHFCAKTLMLASSVICTRNEDAGFPIGPGYVGQLIVLGAMAVLMALSGKWKLHSETLYIEQKESEAYAKHVQEIELSAAAAKMSPVASTDDSDDGSSSGSDSGSDSEEHYTERDYYRNYKFPHGPPSDSAPGADQPSLSQSQSQHHSSQYLGTDRFRTPQSMVGGADHYDSLLGIQQATTMHHHEANSDYQTNNNQEPLLYGDYNIRVDDNSPFADGHR